MDDPHRQPGDRDRDALAARVRQAHELGLIGEVDRDIRLGNIRSAQSMFELDMMGRELDQLQPAPAIGWASPTVLAAPTGAGTPPPTTPTPPTPTPPPSQAWPPSEVVSSEGRRSGAVVVVVAVVLAVVVMSGAAAVFAGIRAVRDALESAAPAESSSRAKESGPAYSLTAKGVRDFLAYYREKHGTSRVVDLTLFGDYVVVDVPKRGGKRQEGWVYREDTGFTSFGGVRASFPGSKVVDTRRLNVSALMRNIDRARRSLEVEKPTQTYGVVRHIVQADRLPSVDIHVANQAGESGYLATRLNGKVERAFPYDRG